GVIDRQGQAFRWNGEAQIPFPDYGGVLHFEPAGQGFDAGWLRSRELVIDFRSGGERLKSAPNRPSRSLKAHYQSLGVPAWQRERLPIVLSGQDLLFAAGIGMDCRRFVQPPATLVALRWESLSGH